MRQHVVILGGGVAGMSAAHELVERGFDVDIYERTEVPGGKARSLPVPGSGVGGLEDLPAEHGFRFFPGFYKHLPDTMRRIPYGQRGSVFDNLVAARQTQLARIGQDEILMPAHFPSSLSDLALAFRSILAFSRFGIPYREISYFVLRLIQLMTTCKDRRIEKYEHQSWWDFIDAPHKSAKYRQYLADRLSRSLVAMQPQVMSARTGGYILLQFLFDFSRPGTQVDRVLNGPTSDVWIRPWRDYLERRGVVYHSGCRVDAIACDGARITGVTVSQNGAALPEIEADYYIAALPIEVMVPLISDVMKAADPHLANLEQLRTSWMNGVLFYLNRDVPIVHGHTNYFDAPWALTSISQKQFWPAVNLAGYGDGTVKGILSAIISDWDTPGLLYHKPARQCTRDEIFDEVWEQIKRHLNDGASIVLDDRDRVRSFLAPSIEFPAPAAPENREPLLINTVGSWEWRPEAITRIANFFLASDYVRTFTDLATMEGANEAARRAVQGILAASGAVAPPCEVWPLDEPLILVPYQQLDCWRLARQLDYEMPRVFPDLLSEQKLRQMRLE